ncbi:type I secretion system permease/ATPase [Aquamicrobium lusatiense]|uniref:type I secretion system permease/ATPase n=1 Tax=Aquamicrobium lusatiense TaxID=89772 RepID=UPI002459044A|nr:type I secretion system permease/ATPase [Aquamicrobium lusatiense]MDH4989329.1 type I secretion system permease/ATPase [Aquamicrobium lusatiense]
MTDLRTLFDPHPQGSEHDIETGAWTEALEYIARHYKVPFSPGATRQLADALREDSLERRIEALAGKLGLGVHRSLPGEISVTSLRLPLIVRLEDGSVGVVRALSADGEAAVIFSGEGGHAIAIPLGDLLKKTDFVVVARPSRAIADERVDAYIAPYREHWLRRISLREISAYNHVFLASFVANTLTLTGVLFSMQVYDRVIPANSYPTLYVLFAGVMLAVVFDFGMRCVRTGLIDVAGKRSDLIMSDLVFGHALRVRNQARPKSTGTFIAQLRDLEQVRELITSTTIAAIADLPFFFLFLAIFWVIGGPLVLVPATALLLLVLPGLLAQRRLRATAKEAMRESSLRNAMLVEAVQGIEDIKALQAEEQFERRWNYFNAVAADAHLRVRRITSGLSAWSHSVQTSTFAVIVFVGAPIVMAGDMTTGALVACSILGSRMIAPMTQLTQVLARVQQAKVGLGSLDAIMKLPTDHPDAETRICAPNLLGNYTLQNATFEYAYGSGRPALAVNKLHIQTKDKIALIGKNGAGKSTLLMALSGMMEPTQGTVLLDNLALGQIDPADVRRHVGLLTQNSRLFHGTIRENVLMGVVHAPQSRLLEALAMVGADEFIRKMPQGLDHPILEGGRGLSGGQQQALLLARLIVRDPSIVLLDEPTASMDETTERAFLAAFREWSLCKTVVIATHRMRVLDLVDRVVAVDDGRIVMDGGKEEALNRLRGVSDIPAADPNRKAKRAPVTPVLAEVGT